MRRLIAGAAAFVMLAVGVAAEEPAPRPWSGFYIGAGLGAGTISQTQTIADSLGPIFSDTFGGTGHFATISAGYDWPVMQRYVVGLFVDYDRSRMSNDSWFTLAPFEHRYSWSIGGRFGYLVTPATLLYGTAGYTQSSFDYFLIGSKTLNGFFVGGGVETQLAGNWLLRGEYRFTQYRDETLIDFCGCAWLEAETSSHTGRVMLVYRFAPASAP